MMEKKQLPNTLFFTWVEEEIAQSHQVRIRLIGTSMNPFLRNGISEVVLVPCKPEELKLLDVVLFRYRGGHVLHRIVRITPNGYTLQGDGVWASCEQCTATDIVARVAYVYRTPQKRLSVTSLSWRLYSKVWHFLRPVRRWLLRLYFLLWRKHAI